MSVDKDKDQDDDRHQKLTDQIADGKAIDWESYESTTDVEKLNKIKAVEQISQAFTKTIVTEPLNSTKSSTQALFQWGHLQVVEKIGEGSFGEVYKAYDPILNRQVALKLRHAGQTSAIGSRAFLQEARRLARVRHPNVIAVHGATVEGDQVGIWTDLIAGKNLKEYILDNGLLDQQSAFDLIKDMAHALNAVHQANLVHGDVKSSNVMRQKNGVFKLMDFGAGSELLEAKLMPLTGTPLLMAPELFEGDPTHPACDMYSLGAMLYQLLSGHYPLSATTAAEIKQLHQDFSNKPLQYLCPKLPRQLCDLIDTLLSKTPSNRPTANQLVEQIKWIKDTPKRRKRIWAVVAIISSLSVGIIISTWGYVNAVRSENKALLSKQESVAVSDFLAEILKSARPGEGGKNTPIIEILEQADKRIVNSLVDQPLARAEVLHHIGKSFQLISLFESSYRTFEKAHAIRLELLGENNHQTLDTQGELGSTLSYLTRFDEAKELLLIDDEIIDSLPIKNNMRMNFWINQSLYYKTNGQFNKAQTILNKALEHTNHIQDPEYHYDVLLQYGNNLLNQLQFESAEVALNEVHNWAKEKSSQKSLLLKTRSALVRLYGQTNRFDKAEKYVRLNLDIKSQWLGLEDESVLWSKALLSKILYAQGRIEESAAVNLEALSVSTKRFGEGYWLTLNLMSDRAERLHSLNQTEEAIRLNIKTIEIAEKAFPNHNYSVLPMKNLTSLYFTTEKFKLATEMANKTIPFIVDRWGKDHLSTLELRYIQGTSTYKLGQVSVAREALNALLTDTTHAMGEEHQLVADIKNTLAELNTSVNLTQLKW